MPTALLFSFLFHDLVMHLGRPRQMTVLYPSHWGHMVVTVLLTWREHRNSLLLIIQYDLHLIASCWKKNVNQYQIFRANPVMQPTGITELLWKTFSLGGKCWAFECLHALYIIWTVYGLLMKTSTYMLTEMLYVRSAEGSVHTSSSATTEEGVSSDFFSSCATLFITHITWYLVPGIVFMW